MHRIFLSYHFDDEDFVSRVYRYLARQEHVGALSYGYTDFIVSQWLTEFVMVPLGLVVLGRKRVPLDGMFWKAVEMSTGQA